MSRTEVDRGRVEVAAVARMLARLGFVHAFGHVSRRVADGMLLTPTRPSLADVSAGDVLEIDASGVVAGDVTRCPLEAPLHSAIYRHRPDVGGICRIHSPMLVSWSGAGGPPPLLHGLGGIAEPVGYWPDPDLITSTERAESVARALAGGATLVLRGNGGLAVGAELSEAITRAWCLEDRCAVALVAVPRSHPTQASQPFTDEELSRRSSWFPNETSRLWAWLLERYGDLPARTP